MTSPNGVEFIKQINNINKYYIKHVVTNININKQNNNNSNYVDIPYNISLPIPLNQCCMDVNTNIENVLTSKRHWKEQIKMVIKQHNDKADNKRINEIQHDATGSTNVPYYVLKYAKLLRSDPDEYFDSYYNWYFSGKGNLCVDTNYIITAINNELYVWNFDGQTINETDSKEAIFYACENMKPIYEVLHCTLSQKQVIGLRQRNKIHLINYTMDRIPQLVSVAIHNTLVPITSVVLDSYRNSVLYSDINNDIHEYNIECQSTTNLFDSETKSTSKINNWNSIHLLDMNTIIKVDKNNLQVLDIRDRNLSLNVSQMSESDCDHITSVRQSVYPHCLYLGSVHNLYECDIRIIKSDAVYFKKWAHGLNSPPIFINSFEYDGYNVILLGSQLINDTCLINDNNNMKIDFEEPFDDHLCKTESDFVYFPKHVPNIVETYNNARKKGFCLDPTIDLNKRLALPRTGLHYLKSNERVQLFNMNAAGDIFSQNISTDFQNNFNGKYEEIEKWAETRLQQNSFIVSSKLNLKHLQNILKRPSNSKIRGRKSKGYISQNKYWKKSLHDLKNYSDIWANELLDIWDVKEMKEGIDNLVPPPIDNKYKIDDWIKQFPMNADD